MEERFSQEKRPFRLHHLILIFKDYVKQTYPLDGFLRNYFRLHKAIGSKDRKWIADTVYELVRWQGLIDTLVGVNAPWEQRVATLESLSKRTLDISSYAPHIRVSFPKILFDLISNAYGEEKALQICSVSNERAPVTIRVNTLKIIREELMQQWKDYDLVPCTQSANGVIVKTNLNFFAMSEFKAGFFELQDEGSQVLSDLIEAKEKDWVLDYCAGAGGKSLAIAARMKNRGQIFLHDIRTSALKEAKKRLNRAGVQNAQFISADDAKKKLQLKGKMDWVLVDAPCSGTGTLRRNPDLKWRFRKEGLQELQKLQEKIFSEALNFVKPGGFIVYATCSILLQENEEQALLFEKKFSLIRNREFSSLPTSGSMDGFYAVRFQKPSL